MKNQFAKIVAVLMVLAMAVSVFGLCASAAETTTEASVALLGDVNLDGKVTIQDATLVQEAIAKLATLDEVQTEVADANEDDTVNVKDATAIQKWIAKFDDANQNIGKPVATADEATKDEPTVDEATKDEPTADEATKDEATTDEPTVDEATKDEPVVDDATKDEPVVDDATKDEPVVDPATEDEATEDEATADELAYYLVGYINGADYGIEADWANNGDYLFVNGTVTVELTATSYVIVKDANGVGYWRNGWLGEVAETVLGEFGANNNKVQVSAGTHTFTWDAATCTLTVA